jgi:cytochrome c-type biogenesis protein CcmH/NrfG
MYAFMQQDPSGNDAIADRAEALINKADSLAPDNSEITSVKSMIATVRMIVNPQQRYMQYGTEANQLMEKAKQQDPTNPRPYYLQGQNLKNTPEQFGGGCKTAKPLLETAMQKYEAFKTQSDIHPNWGKQITEQLLSQCK